MATAPSLGPLVRLWGLNVSQLPAPIDTADELTPFLIGILQEAIPFIDSAASTSGSQLWKHKSDKASSDSAAKVEVWERVIRAETLARIAQRAGLKGKKVDTETWMMRRSVHEDATTKGTASWEEFERCFRLEHAKAEEAFTPNVIATHEAMSWNCEGVEAEEGDRTWGEFQLKVEEMRHKVGKPLKDRTFPVLQMTAKARGTDEFVVVSIPVTDFGSNDRSLLAREKGALVGRYVSVERVRRLDEEDRRRVEWVMATASDAGGILPTWVQNMAMPGVVWKDVPLFMGWIARERPRRDVAKEGVKGGKKTGPESSQQGNGVGTEPQVSTGPETGTAPEASTGSHKEEDGV